MHPYFYDPIWGLTEARRIESRLLVVEDDVWVGHNVVILPSCRRIGRGAVIAAGAIVTQDVPAYAIVAGIPARKLRDRFNPETVAAIEASGWWTCEPHRARKLLADIRIDEPADDAVASLASSAA
jgi:UDP-3-O-[3-hydroxymyristoyl] glucosamine N-acyltransferase